MKPIYTSAPQIGREEIRAVEKVFSDGEMLVHGKQVKLFEKEFADYIGTKYAIAVNSGTDALVIAMKSLQISGDVITTPLSFKATPEAISLCGANPCYVDVHADTDNINEELIKKVVESNLRATTILLVHLYGQPCKMDFVMDLSKKYNLDIIEDSCQAHGATYNGKKVGSIGRVGCWSFYATKNMTTGGNGGMITTNDSLVHESSVLMREHGGPDNQYVSGWNARMNTINAAIGREQLKKLDGFNKRRAEIAQMYFDELQKTNIDLPLDTDGRVYHLYVIHSKYRDRIRKELKKVDVFAGVHYSRPLHQYHCLCNNVGLHLPVAEQLCGTALSLPCHPGLSDEDVKRVCYGILSIKEIKADG